MKNQKQTLSLIQWKNNEITQCKSIDELAKLLSCSKNLLNLFSFNPIYYHFSIPKKKSGSFRQIEAPSLELKQLQRQINDYLQAVYYLNQTKASYGYVLKTSGERNPKDIYTNALKHLGNSYMINADFKDFFHQISNTAVNAIFKSKLFDFDNYTAHTLTKICCYNNRLPMGAPTSPVLSNLYAIGLDVELTKWAYQRNIIFTRFVDDLTFSSNNSAFNPEHFNQINEIAQKYQLEFNPIKTKIFSKNDIKSVTGLILNDTVDIDTAYYQELDKDLIRLKNVMEVYQITGKVENISFLKTFKQELMGKINFIATIEGRDSKEYRQYMNKYEEALEPSEELVQRWTKFSNYN